MPLLKEKNYQAESNPTAILIFRKCKNVIFKNHPNLTWTAFSSSATLILERGSYLTLSYLITGRLPDPMGWEPMQSILNGFKIQGESSSRQWLPNVVRWGKWVLEIKRFQFFLSRQEPSIEWGRWGKKNVTKTLTTKSLSWRQWWGRKKRAPYWRRGGGEAEKETCGRGKEKEVGRKKPKS